MELKWTSKALSDLARLYDEGLGVVHASVRAASPLTKEEAETLKARLGAFIGKTVILDHGNNFQTVYSYNSDILVKVGDLVSQNTVIAKVGRTGRARQPSLHFEVRKNGEPQNPIYYLR